MSRNTQSPTNIARTLADDPTPRRIDAEGQVDQEGRRGQRAAWARERASLEDTTANQIEVSFLASQRNDPLDSRVEEEREHQEGRG
eukprot:390545-Pyramimonas_sp.AAC.1